MSNFLDRLVVEQNELQQKLDKLDGFIHTEQYYKIELDERYLLDQQVRSMRHYSSILKERIAAANGWKPKQDLSAGVACVGQAY